MPTFNATVALLGVNPYVSVPGPVLKRLFVAAACDKSPIRIKITLNDTTFRQTLVRYRGDWRIYLNAAMRKATHKQVGDRLKLNVEYDPEFRSEHMPIALERALRSDANAEQGFAKLGPLRKREILLHLNKLRSKTALERNVSRVVAELRGGVTSEFGVRPHGTEPRKKALLQRSKK